MLLLGLLASSAALGVTISSILSNASSWILAMGGIGLVIFVHELGHFLVAKWCGVRVEVFSLGFGPRLLGFRRGPTDYRLSLVPIGGYVKMAGDNPGDAPALDGTDLPSKSVGQRFAIFSAGVVMNLIFAVVALPIVLALGVQFNSTRIGGVETGGAAWRAGIERGDEVVRIGGHPVDDFNDVIAEIALSGSGGVEMEVARAGTPAADASGARSTETVWVVPEYDRQQGRFVIGVAPSRAPTCEVVPGGAAARAGITAGDRIVRFNGKPLASVDEFEAARIDNRAEQVVLGVRAPDGSERDATVTPDRNEAPSCLLGIRPWLNQVRAVRGRATALAAELLPPRTEGRDHPDDGSDRYELVALERRQADGGYALVQPIRDSEELATAFDVAAKAPADHVLAVRRGASLARIRLPDGIDGSWAEEIALVQNRQSRVIRLLDGYPAAAAGLPDGAEIVRVDGIAVKDWNEIKTGIERAAPDSDDAKAQAKALALVARVGDQERRFEVTPRIERLPSDFGLLPVLETVERRYPFTQAVRVGVSSAGYMLKNVYLTLKGMFVKRVSPSNLSGILTIAYVSKSLADQGIPSLVFFLAILSLNLAFLNLLPIPVLDGGHLLFLIVEKVKGSPVSDRVLGFSQLVGLFLVLALLLFVTYNDLRRLFS